MNLGQIIQSHALSFFHLSAPDFLLGWDTPPAEAQRLRPDRRQRRPRPRRHPPAPVRPGDHRDPRRQEDSSGLGRARRRAQPADRGRPRRASAPGCPRPTPPPRSRSTCSRRRSETHQREVQIFGNFPSLFMGLVDAGRHLGTSRRQAAVHRQQRQHHRRPDRSAEVLRVHRRSGADQLLPQVAVLPAAGLPGRHVPRRPAGAPERGRADGHAQGRRRAEEIQEARAAARSPRRSSITTRG